MKIDAKRKMYMGIWRFVLPVPQAIAAKGMKTFVYRYDSQGINWAYPFSTENTGHKMTASTGEQFFAA